MNLQNERLLVQFRGPDSPPNSKRFDETGCVEQVVLDGKHTFCMPEQVIPTRFTCKGVGLSGELSCYGLAAEAAPGQLFPKFGVGVLRQIPGGTEFDMHGDYEVVTPFPIETSCDGHTAVFRQQPVPCLDMAVRLERTFTLEGTALIMQVRVENTGKRPLKLSEYHHNFVAIDGIPMGPGYKLELYQDNAPEKLVKAVCTAGKEQTPVEGVVRVENNCVYWNQDMENRVLFTKAGPEDLAAKPGSVWKLSHEKSSASIEELVGFSPARVVYWGIEHCICVEVYHDIFVEPGQSATWARTWKFEG